MKSIQRIVLLLLAGAVSTAASARELAPSDLWSGFYDGVHGGYLSGKNDIPGLASVKPDGAFGGFHTGYWVPLSRNWLYGFEADISFSSASGADNAAGTTSRFDQFGTARTRIGYAFDRWLIFASGGLAWARISVNDVPASTPFSSQQNFLGWSATFGAEYALSPRWSARAEFVYLDLGSNRENFFLIPSEQNVTAGLFRVGLNYRIGGVPEWQQTAAPRQTNFIWQGAYIGVHAGRATGTQNMEYSFFVPFEPKGTFGGLQGGYNWQIASNFVAGIESDVSFANIEGDFLAGCCVVKIDRFGTARLRAGYAFDQVLFYVTGGLAWAKTDNNYFNGLVTSDRPFVGTAAGIGIEYALSPLWTVKGEYLRLKFENNESIYNIPPAVQFTERAEYDIYRIGLNYRASLFDVFTRR